MVWLGIGCFLAGVAVCYVGVIVYCLYWMEV